MGNGNEAVMNIYLAFSGKIKGECIYSDWHVIYQDRYLNIYQVVYSCFVGGCMWLRVLCVPWVTKVPRRVRVFFGAISLLDCDRVFCLLALNDPPGRGLANGLAVRREGTHD